MTNAIQCVIYLVILVGLAIPLGKYIALVMDGKKTSLSKITDPCVNGCLRLLHINQDEQMDWKRYSVSVLMFSAIGLFVVMALQMLQAYLPYNPAGAGNISWDLAFNTAASFVSNTNWQAYAGELDMSYLTQLLGLTVQNFVSAATGIAVLFALIRGFRSSHTDNLGNFWNDMVRIIMQVLIPVNFVIAIALVGCGVVQNVSSPHYVQLLEPIAIDAEGQIIEGASIDDGVVSIDGMIVEDAQVVDKQFVPGGPAASQIAIKQSGTNGGGFFGVNSAHPLENPNLISNVIEMTSILLIPVALCFTFGVAVGNPKQGVALFAAMFIMLIFSTAFITTQEQNATPALNQNGAVSTEQTVNQDGGNMEGKESRFGLAASTTWSAYTTAASSGSVNSMHDSYTPLAGMMLMLQMQLGEVVFGGVGSGLYGMLAFAIFTVFIAGLMVGRTPEFLGKKIEPNEMKWAAVACLTTPVVILAGCALAAILPSTNELVSAGNAGGAHAFCELLYTFTSTGANNGSAFAGFAGNTVFVNVVTGVMMLVARFVQIVAVLAIAGSLSSKKFIAQTAGTLSTTNAMFVFLLIFIVLLIGALSFFPALALGPIAEFLGMFA